MTRVQNRIRMEEKLGYSPLFVFLKETGEFIGSCGLRPVTEDSPDVEIAYHIMPTAWGRGYATEAAKATLEFGFNSLGLEAILGYVMTGNIASCKVLEKSGMTYVGLARYPGVDFDVRKYIAKRETWSIAPKT